MEQEGRKVVAGAVASFSDKVSRSGGERRWHCQSLPLAHTMSSIIARQIPAGVGKETLSHEKTANVLFPHTYCLPKLRKTNLTPAIRATKPSF